MRGCDGDARQGWEDGFQGRAQRIPTSRHGVLLVLEGFLGDEWALGGAGRTGDCADHSGALRPGADGAVEEGQDEGSCADCVRGAVAWGVAGLQVG